MLAQNLGDYFVFVSHDDELSPLLLETLVNALSLNPDASVAYSDVKRFPVNGGSEILSYEFPVGVSSTVIRGM